MNNYITIKQNEPESIELLSAMRHLYNKAKFIRIIRVAITVLLPIISVITLYLYPPSMQMMTLISAIWLILHRIFLQEIEKKNVKNAAKIQEEFDERVFQLNWNETLVGTRIEKEEIKELCQSFKGDKEKLKDWYPGLNASHHFLNVLIAQRTNVKWDINLRKFYTVLLAIIIIVYLVLIITIGMVTNLSLQTFLLSFLVPSLPLLLHMAETLNSHKQRYQSLESIVSKLTKEINNFSSEGVKTKCREFQDAIFIKRCDINTIPDKVYWIKRLTYDKLAKEVNETFSNNTDINN